MKEREEFIDSVFNEEGTDKRSTAHNYAQVYARIPEDIKTVLEIGVADGASLRSWKKIFPQAQVWGVDKSMNQFEGYEHFHLIPCGIESVVVDPLPAFDLIVDDGSHIVAEILIAFERLKEKWAGWYVIEDVGDDMMEELGKALADYSPVYVKTGDGDSRVMIL